MSDIRRPTPDEWQDNGPSSAAGGPGEQSSSGRTPGQLLRLRGARVVAQADSMPAATLESGDTQSPGVSGSAEELALQGAEQPYAGQQTPSKRGKRTLPLPDLDAIQDVEERRRQRRLIKNRNTAAASRVRKQRELEELAQRMRALQDDNTSLRGHVETRNTEILRLRAIIQDMHDAEESPQGLQMANSRRSSEGGGPPEWDTGGQQRGEAAPDLATRVLPAHSQPGSSHSHLGSPEATWPAHPSPSRGAASQEGHPGLSLRQLPAALTEEQFAQRFAMAPEPGRVARNQVSKPDRAAQGAIAAPSSLSAAAQRAHDAAGGQRLQHMRGGAGEAAARADFMAFPWGEVMEMSEADPWPPPGAIQGR